ncbi:hypothetical protein KIW84_035732 [Lathyrus oleraceus]|uniref:Uncharacterized protein n=1 Tax=Pisum sativum TaxID=3888 RepID=A0A9D5B733_PEA|nr:hypothetical protein KIW84_035732 [Pisum sativum]
MNTYNNNNTNNNHQRQNFERKKVSFNLIPMSYAELYPSLVLKNLIQPRNPPQIPEPLPWWYKPELRCAFHQGAPGHDIENCYPLKYEVQKLMKSGMVSFEDRVSNVKANSLPSHGNSSVNMVDGCPGEFKVFDVRFIKRSLVQMHKDVCMVSECEHDHDGCVVCSVKPRGCEVVKRDIQCLMDEGMIQIVQSRHVDDDVNVIVPVFKQSEKLVIKYNSSNSNSPRSASSLDGQEVPLPTTSSVVSIADVAKVTRSGRVFGSVFPKDKEEAVLSKKVEVPVEDPVGCSKDKSSESSNLKPNDDDEVLRLIKRSEFNVVEQLLQTPSKISVLSLLMNSEAHREALQRVLEQAFVEYDFTVDQFDHIVANITSCNSLSSCDEELPEEGRNHNLALHISMNCKEDALSNVLVDTGSSLNVLPKSTLSKLSYQGAPMRYIGVIVEAKDELGTPFQALSIAAEKRVGAPMSSLKDAQKIVVEGDVDQWGRMVEVSDNKGRTGLGFQKGSLNARSEDMQLSFRSGGFIHGNEQYLAVVLEDAEEEDCTNFVTHGKACNNWTAVDIPIILYRSKLVPNPVEYNDPSPSPNFEFPVFEAEEESDVEVSDELSRLLEQDENTIQPFEEQVELVNLGSKDDVKEVKIGSRLCLDVKKGLIDLLREYLDVFAWFYQDMPGLDSEIVEHRLPLKPECPPVKQKLRRTHPDMAVKIKEEVQK